MSCGLPNKFEKAVDAVREAFKAAVDQKDFDRNTLSEVWRHYQGLQTIAEGLPECNDKVEITFSPDTVLGDSIEFNSDTSLDLGQIDFGAAETVNVPGGLYGAEGNDVITFS